MTFIVTTFYHFFDFKNYADMRMPMLEKMHALDIKGSILIAPEGANATITGTREAIDAYITYLENDIVKDTLTTKESTCNEKPFGKGKVRIKAETIRMGEKVDLSQVGEYVEPKDWDALLQQENTIVLDTRNDYETYLGTFKGAIVPDIHNFRDLPTYMREKLPLDKEAPIATFCTGGIRCEKFTAWMKQEGYQNVYHLKGGILKYMEEIPKERSSWQGECFVFDERVAVDHDLAASKQATYCLPCGHTLKPEDRDHPHYSVNYSCPYCHKDAK